MLSPEQTNKPLILSRKSELLMANIAVKDTYGNQHPVAKKMWGVLDVLDWADTTISIEGQERDMVLHALTERALRAPENSLQPTADESWKQKQAAIILGNHFASLMEPTFTADMIATGLIEHNPDIQGPISDSIPVFVSV